MIQFSKNDVKKGIKIPIELNEDLAYLLGFHFGDGYMSISHRKNAVDYIICYSGNFINEKEYYEDHIACLISKLFNLNTKIRKSTKNTVQILFRSKAIVEFMHKICGLPLGKKDNADVPEIIKNAEPRLQKAFIRGLADTDFCISFKKSPNGLHNRSCISHCCCCKPLWLWLQNTLIGLGFKVNTSIRHRVRKSKPFTSYTVEICGERMLKLWLDNIGFSSYNHTTKIDCWQLLGFSPPNTNIHYRSELIRTPPGGFEPPTSWLTATRSTTKLQGHLLSEK